MSNKIYPESKVELTPGIAKHYDRILNSISFGKYNHFIKSAIREMQVGENDHILDLGCGTGKNASLLSEYLGKNGKIVGVDLSPVMEKQFIEKHRNDDRISFKKQRIDIPFDIQEQFDIVFISFVIHGFPHEIREQILKNAYNHLKPGAQLFILDFSEFDMNKMPPHHRFVFKKVECIYAFDFIEKDWKSILKQFGFGDFNETLFFRGYARLLSGRKK